LEYFKHDIPVAENVLDHFLKDTRIPFIETVLDIDPYTSDI